MKGRLSRTIGAKVSEQEYAEIETRAAAENKTTSAWVRDVLLAQVGSPTAHKETCIVLGELLALRTIIATLQFEASVRPPLKPETVREVMAVADRDKLHRAAELLKNINGGN